MGSRGKAEFTWVEGVAIAVAAGGVQVASEVIQQWGTYFYSQSEGTGRTIYVGVGLVGTVFAVGMLFDAITDPLVGFWSDKTRTTGRFRLVPISGRRRPFIFWGSIFMTVTGIAFWYPPVEGTSSANFWYAMVMVCLHWAFFTICMVPINSLQPEIARSQHARMKLGAYYSVGMMVGIALAAVMPGFLIEALDPARHTVAENGQPAFSALGYQRMGIIVAIIGLIALQGPTWILRERYRDDATVKRAPVRIQLKAALTNRLFIMWFIIMLFFNVGFLAVQKVLPYWVEIGLGGSEAMVSALMGPFVLAAILVLPAIPWLSKRIAPKWLLFIAIATVAVMLPIMYVLTIVPWAVGTKIVAAAIMFSIVGMAQGLLFALYAPLMGQVVDQDAAKSGERRESVYVGISGMSWKGAQALAVYVATVPMDLWGNSVERPNGVLAIGPIAAVPVIIAAVIAWFYPVVRTQPSDETLPRAL
ncbi:MAG: MFS transporter [bacterium]|nr:MFS transporter [bacterium]